MSHPGPGGEAANSDGEHSGSTSETPDPSVEPESVLSAMGWREVVQALVGLGAAGALVFYGLPFVADTTWPQIGEQLALVGLAPALAMAGLLVAGLYCYTFTMIGSLPGLNHLRAFTVNTAGSMVANILPGGGAIGVAVTYLMFRSWGFARAAIGTSLIVTTIWNMLARLTLPILGGLAVLLGPVDAPRSVVVAALVATAMGLLFLGFFGGVVFSDTAAREVGSAVATLTSPVARRFPRVGNLNGVMADQRVRIEGVVRRSSVMMSLGLVGMFGCFFVLYVVSARTVGVELALIPLFAAYAFRQFLTVVAITPGGLGITEVGTAGILVAFGGDPASAAAAALLYAVFTHLLEVPLGAFATLGWWLTRNRSASNRPRG
ncbi:MAG: lysylphosphatidylglycerol synthase transmembrane domain-containing protein [Ornithinimicrobium sp.]